MNEALRTSAAANAERAAKRTPTQNRVVVTGLGAWTPAGCGAEETWSGLLSGRSRVAPISRFPADGFTTSIAAQSAEPETPVSRFAGEHPSGLDRITAMAKAAAREALVDAGLLPWQDVPAPDGCGLVVAAGQAFFEHFEIFEPLRAAMVRGQFDEQSYLHAVATTVGPRAFERLSPDGVRTLLARDFALDGPSLSVDTACAASAQAIVDAARWIRSGFCDRVLAGGVDSQITPLGLASFSLLGALSRRNDEPEKASRPFDRQRDGFVLGEGAGFLVLESLTAARQRGAVIYAELAGGASTCDSYRATDPHPEGSGARRAMSIALAQAALAPNDIGYVNAHGTSTRRNDPIESVAIAAVFGGAGQAPPVSSTKSMIGHLTVAAGAVEAIVTVLSLRDQTLAPTINLDHPDPECRLDYVPHRARRHAFRHAMTNSFGFGGQCCSLLLSFWEHERDGLPARPKNEHAGLLG